MNRPSFRPGVAHASLSLVVVAAVVAVIAAASPIPTEIGGRLAVATAAAFALALAYGSARLVGMSSIPMVAAALAASSRADPAWVRSIVIGCLWYVAVELAWESISRRDRGVPSEAVSRRRMNEVATVVTVALVVSTAAFILADAAPQQTLLSQGLVIVGLITVVVLATRTLSSRVNEGASTRAPS